MSIKAYNQWSNGDSHYAWVQTPVSDEVVVFPSKEEAECWLRAKLMESYKEEYRNEAKVCGLKLKKE